MWQQKWRELWRRLWRKKKRQVWRQIWPQGNTKCEVKRNKRNVIFDPKSDANCDADFNSKCDAMCYVLYTREISMTSLSQQFRFQR
jgi:hypothetical protein